MLTLLVSRQWLSPLNTHIAISNRPFHEGIKGNGARCISFRLHQRPKPSFRIFFITLNSPPVFVEVFCLKTAEVKCAPKEKRKWDRKTGCNLCAQILIAGVWLLFFLSEPLPGYPDLLSIWKHSVFFFKNNYFFILAVLGLCCCAQASSSRGDRGCFLVVVPGLLVVSPLVAEHGFYSVGSGGAAHRLSYLAACGILPDRGSAGGLWTMGPPGQPLWRCYCKATFKLKKGL